MPRRPPKDTRPVDPRAEAALDTALAASFPASDPIAVLEPAAERPRIPPAAPAGWPDGRSQSPSRNKGIQP
jgi:hypothetical protein